MRTSKWAILGMVATAVGVAMEFAAAYFGDKEMEIEIEERVSAAVQQALEDKGGEV